MSRGESVGTDCSARTRETRRFVCLLNPKLLTTALGSVATVVLAGLVQVSFGPFPEVDAHTADRYGVAIEWTCIQGCFSEEF